LNILKIRKSRAKCSPLLLRMSIELVLQVFEDKDTDWNKIIKENKTDGIV